MFVSNGTMISHKSYLARVMTKDTVLWMWWDGFVADLDYDTTMHGTTNLTRLGTATTGECNANMDVYTEGSNAFGLPNWNGVFSDSVEVSRGVAHLVPTKLAADIAPSAHPGRSSVALVASSTFVPTSMATVLECTANGGTCMATSSGVCGEVGGARGMFA